MNKLILPLQFYSESGSKRKGTFRTGMVVPTWNHIYEIRRNRPSPTEFALKYKDDITEIMKQWMEENKWESNDTHKIIVNIQVYFPNKVRRDCHNLDKIVLDAMEDADLFANDCQCLVRYIDFQFDKENPRFEIDFEIGEIHGYNPLRKEEEK